ncbi:MAG: ispE [Rhodospirillales bacterium]|nr:ispE [Rhodospirillales bacterium]
MTSTPLILAAPAKLNLYLHVTGKRADGYHLLDSLAAFIDVHDTLTLTPSSAIAFTTDGLFANGFGDEDPSTNLVVRAARGLAEATGRAADVALHLTKNLPVASGIGGGSADAAACLCGLARLWGLDPGDPAVLGVAAGLGADVPVCVHGRAAYMGGIGTEIAAAPELPPAGLVLVNPGIGLSTPSVYRARRGDFSPAGRFDAPPADAAGLAALLAERGNDLTDAAVSLVPEIAAVLNAIGADERCLLARMSGSGATCFGIFTDVDEAAAAAALLKRDHPGWWVAPGRLLSDAHTLDGQNLNG